MYAVAHRIWGITRFIWMVIIIGILIGLSANILSGKLEDFYKATVLVIGTWLAGPAVYQRLTLFAIVVFIFISLSSGLISLFSKNPQQAESASNLSQEIQPVISQLQTITNSLQMITAYLRNDLEAKKEPEARRQDKDNSTFFRYLRFIEESNANVNFGKIIPHAQTMLSANAPLDDIFVHLEVIPDRPVYDALYDQQGLINAIRQHKELSIEEREEHIQRLGVMWQFQLGKRWAGPQQSISIEEALQHLGPENTTAVILGSPGSGKSILMRWLALHMAQAFLSSSTLLPGGLAPRQIPILIRISDYAEKLEQDHLTVKQFLITRLSEIYAGIPDLLLDELASGHCLVLFDGLDEIVSADIYRRAAEAIFTFIAEYSSSPKAAQLKTYNRFLITSRIVSYEPGNFAEWAHYTLIDMGDQQIGQFLTNWCPAIERYKVMSTRGMQPLTEEEKADASTAGIQQRDYILSTLQNNPEMKSIAANPFISTMMTVLQLNGIDIRYNRVDFYKAFTQTFLDMSNRRSLALSEEEFRLAERMLCNVAYHLQSTIPVFTENEVKAIAHQAMVDLSQRELSSIKDSEIEKFIELLRTSGVFVKCGRDLFCFARYAFQEYFVAMYLLCKPVEELKQFAMQFYSSETWREPLLLALNYKSRQGNRNEQREAEEIIRTIAEIVAKETQYNERLHRNLLFTVSSIADSGAWSISSPLQHQISSRIFDFYGDAQELGHYSQQQQEVKGIVLYWLNAQPQVRGREEITPPLLESWRRALCNATNPIQQEGAVHLLAELAPDLSNRMLSVLVLRTLIPPLLQLADLLDPELPFPGAVRQNLPQPPARPASLRVEEYAYIALRRLDTYGPAKWLHDNWLKWNEKQPQLLVSLNEHSRALLYLITPAAFPGKADSPHWAIQRKIGNTWQQLNQQQSSNVQTQLLDASDTARYPLAYLLYQLLESETASRSFPSQPWYIIWDTFLQEEMRRGRSAAYPACLSLRLMLSRVIEQQPLKLANELEASLLAQDRRQTQALIAIAQLYWRNAPITPELAGILETRKMLDYLNTRDIIDMQDLQSPNNMRYSEYTLSLKNALDARNIGDKLCSMLEKTGDTPDSVLLFTLYCITTFDQFVSEPLIKRVLTILQRVIQRRAQQIPMEHRLLIEAIQGQISHFERK